MATTLPPITEAAFQRQVLQLAKLHGWRVFHARAAQTRSGRWLTPVAGDGAGFPDLVLVRERVLYRELKTDRGILRPEQRAWIAALERAGQDVGVWRPQMWAGIIEALR